MVELARDWIEKISTAQHDSSRYIKPDYSDSATDLLHVAFCQADKNALDDIAKLSGRNDIYLLFPEEKIWLRFQLNKHGVDTAKLDESIKAWRASSPTSYDYGADINQRAERYFRKLESIGEEVGPPDRIRQFCLNI